MEDLSTIIQENKRKAEDEAMWGKPANDIITGIQKNDGIKSERALWEMIQNARDVSIDSGAEIEFIRNEEELVFRHNGLPFDNKSLAALNLQTSSKVRNDIIQIGQYGTGFLTTHKFGLKFYLTGSIKVHEDVTRGYFYDFKDFCIDRSPDDKSLMIYNLKKQQEKIKQMGCDITTLKKAPSQYTEFHYRHEFSVESQRIQEAFSTSPKLAPYVIALNKRINSITFTDNISGSAVSFCRKSFSEVKKTDDYVVLCVETLRKVSGDVDKCFKVFLLESIKKRAEKTGDSLITVILPLKEQDNKLTAFKFDEKIPMLFLYLPLIGSEKWGFNFILHSPSFTCETENRSSLRFVGNGQNNDKQAAMNKEIATLANGLIMKYLDDNLSNIEDVKHLSYVAFDYTNQNPELADYYKSLQEIWVKKLQNLKICKIEDGTLALPKDMYVLDEELRNEANDNKDFLNAIYEIFKSKFNTNRIPCKENLLFWSNVISKWYPTEPSGAHFFVTSDEIAQHINSKAATPEVIGYTNILEFDKFLVKTNHADYFDKYALIATEQGPLKKKTELLKPSSFNDTMRTVMSILAPDDVCRFVKTDFSELMKYTEYCNTDLKETLSNRISSLQEDQFSINNQMKSSILAGNPIFTSDQNKWKEAQLSTQNISAMLEFSSMIIDETGGSFWSRLLISLKEFYNFEDIINDSINKDIFDARSTLRTLINNALFAFSLMTAEEQLSKKEWLKSILAKIYEYEDVKSTLYNYQVYPDQEGIFKYSKQLKKEKGIPKRLKEIFDVIVRQVNSDNMSKSIRHDLVDNDYADFFIESTEMEGQTIANELFIKVKTDIEYPKISDYKYRNLVIEIIQNLTDENWKQLFPSFEHDKATMMMSIIENEEKKESIFRIMKVEDQAKLKTIAELAENEDFERIITLGKMALQAERESRSDFDYKMKLGKYVEDYLQKELQEKLEPKSINVDVNNQQGGQDLIVKCKDEPVYYIEIKSRWTTSDSIMMSALQMERSVEEASRYALCSVSMIDFDKTFVEKHEYPPFEEVLSRIKVVEHIGNYNKEIIGSVREGDLDKVHIGGDYKSVVPQKLINMVGVDFNSLLNIIVNTIQNSI